MIASILSFISVIMLFLLVTGVLTVYFIWSHDKQETKKRVVWFIAAIVCVVVGILVAIGLTDLSM